MPAVKSAKAKGILLSVGTKKGLFQFRSDASRDKWRMSGSVMPGAEVFHAVMDARTGRMFAAHTFMETRVSYSDDLGKTWVDAKETPRFTQESGMRVEPATGVAILADRVWRLEPGRATEPGVVYCGTPPAALFRSEDNGVTWGPVSALNNHPTRSQWFPGAGGLCLHSIVLDPKDKQRMWVGISSPSVFGTKDGGRSWQPRNSGIKNGYAEKYDPKLELYPEIGQCVHHLVRAAGNRPKLYAQVHWGTFRSDDGAKSWKDITAGLPSDFGMVMAAHPRNSDVAYVLPLQSGEMRTPPEGKLRVYRTENAGKTWEALTKGLPQRG
ncbi:MAG: exo-alpha-sialidase, partial [SAR202 cluster bacterium]|nr:exo-alpha-sialidase [SAR202 cluster bacterium]